MNSTHRRAAMMAIVLTFAALLVYGYSGPADVDQLGSERELTPRTGPATETAAADTANDGNGGPAASSTPRPRGQSSPTPSATPPGSTATIVPSAAPTAPATASVPSQTPAPTATITAVSTPSNAATVLRFVSIGDASIDGTEPGRNAGSASELETDDEPNKDFLLKFDLSGIDGYVVTSARLRLRAVDDSGVGGDVYLTASSWVEATVSWDSAPPPHGPPIASLGSVSSGSTYEVDVTPVVATDGALSFRVASSSRDGADYASREGTHPPELVVTLQQLGSSLPPPTLSPRDDPPTATPTSTATEASTPAAPTTPAVVVSSVETDPVGSGDDAADDPAIWIHPQDPALSLVIGTERASGGGLRVYGLDGRQRQFLAIGSINNVDVRYGFPLSTGAADLVTGTHSDDDDIVVFAVDVATRTLFDVRASSPPGIPGAYGYCMYRSFETGEFHGFASSGGSGTWRQVTFREDRSEPGHVTYEVVRLFDHPLDALSENGREKMEGCVADDRTGSLYVSEEEYGIVRYGAEPSGGSAYDVFSTVESNELSPDIEGLALFPTGRSRGYLIASDQGVDQFSVFELPAGRYRGRFSIGAGGTTDAVSHTDGIAVANGFFNPSFQQGLLVAQDDRNSGGNQNFKLVAWESIAAALGLQ